MRGVGSSLATSGALPQRGLALQVAWEQGARAVQVMDPFMIDCLHSTQLWRYAYYAAFMGVKHATSLKSSCV